MKLLPWLPHLLAKRVERYREFRRLGVGARLSLLSSIKPSSWSSFLMARLNLLPDNFLASIGTVVDVGANRGDWSAQLLRYATPRRLMAIEPNPSVFQALAERLRQYGNCQCLNLALSSQPAQLVFHVTAGSQCASLLKPREAMVGFYGQHFAEQGTIVVAADTLDKVTADCPEIALLKIDVQGYEREVLAGAKETLRKTQYVLVEVNFISHYENDILFAELDSLMQAHGFVLANCSPPERQRGIICWADALYAKSEWADAWLTKGFEGARE